MLRSTFTPLTLLLFCIGCAGAKWQVPAEITGAWYSSTVPVTVRIEPRFMHFEFTRGSADFELQIRPDNTVSGRIGKATFENGTIAKNGGHRPPSVTGVAYIVRCGAIGKIFDTDPDDQKEVELWLGPLENGQMSSELRFTEHGAQFPMGDPVFKKR